MGTTPLADLLQYPGAIASAYGCGVGEGLEPWTLVSNADPTLDLVWGYAQRCCCMQLFRHERSGLLQLESRGLRESDRIDHLLLVIAIAVLVSSLQGYAVSLAGLRRQVVPHWQWGMSFVRIALASLQQCVANAGGAFMAWRPIPPGQLEPCTPSRSGQRRQKQPSFTRFALPPRPRPQHRQHPAVA
jgi:hypothetical protein